MTTPPDDLTTLVQQLTEAMAKATPGPWHSPGLGEVHSDHDRKVYTARPLDEGGALDPVVADLCYDTDADYIALCSPENIARLLSALAQAQQWRSKALQLALHYSLEDVLANPDQQSDSVRALRVFELLAVARRELKAAEARAAQAEQRAEAAEAWAREQSMEEREQRAEVARLTRELAEAQRIAAYRLDTCPYWQSDPGCACVVCRLREVTRELAEEKLSHRW